MGVDDSNSLLTASYANGRVVGFSLTGDLIAPNPAGTLLAVLAYEPNGNNFGGTFEASVSNFVFADENYMELNVCDLDFNPLNGCEVSTTFDYSIDCNGDDYGDAYLDSCGVCSGGNSGHEADSDIDCNGDCFGEAYEDSCGVCSVGNSGHEADSDIDCNGDCFGEAYEDLSLIHI